MPSLPDPSSDSFREFVERITERRAVERLAAETSWMPEALGERLALAAGEAAQTLRVLAGIDINQGDRLLEVGSGLGLTSAYLSTVGFDVTALEPAALGFQEHSELATRVARFIGARHAALSIGAEDLRERDHGRFALLFSNNVLEHVPDPRVALTRMADVMSSDGLMVHSCPNYSIPFEPHFGIPLVPIRPEWTGWLLPRSVRHGDVWRSLNFVRARDVIRTTRDLGLRVHFRTGSLATSLERLGDDPEFGARHRSLARVAGGLRRIGLVPLLRRLPATWSTPMDFLIDGPDSDRRRVAQWLHPWVDDASACGANEHASGDRPVSGQSPSATIGEHREVGESPAN